MVSRQDWAATTTSQWKRFFDLLAVEPLHDVAHWRGCRAITRALSEKVDDVADAFIRLLGGTARHSAGVFRFFRSDRDSACTCDSATGRRRPGAGVRAATWPRRGDLPAHLRGLPHQHRLSSESDDRPSPGPHDRACPPTRNAQTTLGRD